MDEFNLINQIEKIVGKKFLNKVVKGIGDDCAIIEKYKNTLYAITTDSIVESVHFNLKYYTFFDVGWKALAVSLSDIAAMGAVPKYALVDLGIKKKNTQDDVVNFYRGFIQLAKKFHVDVIGGNITLSPQKFIANVFVIGEVERNTVLLRSGAKIGDAILVTGNLGRASIIKRKSFNKQRLKIIPRIKEGKIIAESQIATSMMDSSDGLAFTVSEICKQSNVGAYIDVKAIPKEKDVSLNDALYFGEDYELVFTCSPAFIDIIKTKIEKACNTKVTVIGKIVEKSKGINIKVKGFNHFK